MNNITASVAKMATAVAPAVSATLGPADAPGAVPALPPAVAAPLPRRRVPEDAADYVTVSDPVLHADGINKYTSFRVDCRPPVRDHPADAAGDPTAPGGHDAFRDHHPGQYSSVLRRYSDFVWLAERLHRERAGAVVPPLPEKQAVARFSPEFVEERRVALERFLRRAVLHPELWDAEGLGTFLRADDAGFRHAKAATRGEDGAAGALPRGGPGDLSASASLGGAGAFSLAPKNKAGIKRWFSEAKTTFAGELVASPDDDLFDEIERYVGALFVQMKRVAAQVSGLVKKNREVANGMFEFGLAFHQLGQSEGEALGRKLQLMGGTADVVSALAAQHAEAERRGLEEPLRDYLGAIHAVKLALGRRHDRRVSYTALLHEIRTREASLQRLQMSPGAGAKAYQTETSLQRYRAAADAAREEYAECSQRVLREVDRFKREKAEEMRAVVRDLIALEIEANRSMERAWGELVPRLEEGGAALPAAAPPHAPQPTVVSMPPPPPTAPPAAMAPAASSQPTYTNVPATTLMGGAAAPMGGAAMDPMMESSIQYRDDTLPGMGF